MPYQLYTIILFLRSQNHVYTASIAQQYVEYVPTSLPDNCVVNKRLDFKSFDLFFFYYYHLPQAHHGFNVSSLTDVKDNGKNADGTQLRFGRAVAF